MLRHPLAKPLFFFICLGPILWITGNAIFSDLGANPVEAITHQTGDWTLRLLLLTLALTPLRRATGMSDFIRFRRMAGLFVYFYASCHFLIWFLADHGLDVSSMFEDVVERPYVTLGFLAFVLLTPLALTSNRWSIRKLGKRWKHLHNLVYIIIILAVSHFLWLVKADYSEPVIYALIATILLIARLERFKLIRQVNTEVKSI